MTAFWITGDTRKVMDRLPPGSVDLCLSSPPFLALRSYLPDDDPAKADEIGSEANPAEFIDTLLDVTEACARLLAPHGTLCVELGDTYSGSGGAGGDYAENGLRAGQQTFRQTRINGRNDKVEMAANGIVGTTSGERAKQFGGWPEAKSLALIPEAYRMALAYGRNPHNGRPTDPWRIRNVIRWTRPNPPVGALADKFRPATSEMVVACKAKDRWFDLDAVRAPTMRKTCTCCATGWEHSQRYSDHGSVASKPGNVKRQDSGVPRAADHPGGAPPLDWWQISPGGYSGAHYAVFPAELCIKPIEAMCPRRVCRTCSKPSRRLVDRERRSDADDSTRNKTGGPLARSQDRPPEIGWEYDRTTTGWSTCGCPGSDGIRLDGYHTGTGWRPGIVLDPFCGSGTTLSVAVGHGRDGIGIDLDARNADLARDRIGMFFQEVTAEELTEILS